MSDLGDVLELLHGADRSFRSVRAAVRKTNDPEITKKAWERQSQEFESGGGFSVWFAVGDGDVDDLAGPQSTDELSRVWFEQPDRLRVETEGAQRMTFVSDGQRSWHDMPYEGPIQDDRRRVGLGDHAPLFAPAEIMPVLDFEVRGRSEVVGRPVLDVAARPHPRSSDRGYFESTPHALGSGADAYSLAIDLERGVLLRATAWLDGEEFQTTEVVEVAFDEPIDPERFTFTPAAGQTVRTPEEAYSDHRFEMGIEDVAARAPFTVFAVAGLGPEWEMHVGGWDESSDPSEATVWIHYVREAGTREQFSLTQSAADAPRRELHVSFGGREPERVEVERGGTSIELSSSDLDRDRLTELADSLVPARTTPPSLLR